MWPQRESNPWRCKYRALPIEPHRTLFPLGCCVFTSPFLLLTWTSSFNFHLRFPSKRNLSLNDSGLHTHARTQYACTQEHTHTHNHIHTHTHAHTHRTSSSLRCQWDYHVLHKQITQSSTVQLALQSFKHFSLACHRHRVALCQTAIRTYRLFRFLHWDEMAVPAGCRDRRTFDSIQSCALEK